MELAQLRYFVTVVEEGGFTRAGARLHVSQPGVSAQVRRLERELGLRLLDRSGRRVTPTEAGEAVLSYARAALAAVEGIRRTAEEVSGLLRGRVSVGLIPGAAGAVVDGLDVIGVLGDFHDAHPEVEIALAEDTSERMLAGLRRGELDLAVIGLDGEPPAGISVQVVLAEPLVAAVRPDDPLVRASLDGEIALTALSGRPLICLPRGTGLRGVLERACAEAGFGPRVDFEAAAPAVLVRLAARGLGVAVVPAGAESAAGADLRALRITEPALSARVALAWRTDGPSGPAARTLLTRLRTRSAGAAPGPDRADAAGRHP
ncbi:MULTISPECIES: LysR family transcriptional regulator [unclassified Streptomyces]|uniref:LysR family transcriptional regulator n=1 Tax=unclassified Streptomyces TaxID=2593676 RepID=UPI002251EB53|nr:MULTISPECIES: LysR family transcriptional regulator [unclassified Streptomyces]MCX4528500.1 LysR family transcriptional regulator [Streptomyces sp. NBC_01551]MCX4540902.1 LysR family transcriptional regulator [Streptomyces sp. NBC_01565]